MELADIKHHRVTKCAYDTKSPWDEIARTYAEMIEQIKLALVLCRCKETGAMAGNAI